MSSTGSTNPQKAAGPVQDLAETVTPIGLVSDEEVPTTISPVIPIGALVTTAVEVPPVKLPLIVMLPELTIDELLPSITFPFTMSVPDDTMLAPSPSVRSPQMVNEPLLLI